MIDIYKQHLKAKRANVFNIPPGVNFLKTLVESLLSGQLIDGWSFSNPLDLADVTIFVPTRRAARSLINEFHTIIGRSLLLPDIRPLGDSHDDGSFLSDMLVARPIIFDPVLPVMERRLLLAQFILTWRNSMAKQAAVELGGDRVSLPSGPVDAVSLAEDLARLIDQMATEECDWDGLKNLVPDQYQAWWSKTFEFLQIATSAWPEVLKERGAMDPAEHRRAVLDHQTALCKSLADTKGPVIAAGSTGSIPATARLLRAICQLPKGAVILPGVDRHLDIAAWHQIGRLGSPKSQPSHPQYGLKTLLSDDANDENRSSRHHSVLPITRADLRLSVLSEPPHALQIRERLVSEMMRPATATETWANTRSMLNDDERGNEFSTAIEDIHIIEAPDMHVEALSIATALRACLSIKGKKAALVTPDRELARRVGMALRRFNIHADDSAGQPLRLFPQVALIKLLLKWGAKTEHDKRLVLAALLKHPLCALGLPLSEARRRARLFELAVLRGNTATPSVGNLLEYVVNAQTQLTNKTHMHSSQRRIKSDDWEDCKDVANRLDKICAPLIELESAPSISLSKLAVATTSCFEGLCKTDLEPFGKAYENEAGEELIAFLRSLIDNSTADEFNISFGEWGALFDSLISGVTVRSRRPGHPRISILGPLEARLLNVDLVILGGLNEGTWPAAQQNDPFLSRLMKMELGLEPPERRIGQAAHDIQMAMGTKEVFLTRSLRVDDAPTVPSRWLQRLEAVLGESVFESLKNKGNIYVNFAQEFDRPDTDNILPAIRPNPKPPLALRPQKFSFTEIERLIRDPYAIYAKRILKLSPIDPLICDPSMADQGTLLHAIFASWIRNKHDPKSPNGLETLLGLGHEHFESLNLPPEVRAFWWPRFKQIAHDYLKWQIKYEPNVKTSFVEVSGSLNVGPQKSFTLSGRADRIDINHDGKLVVMDYKSSTRPSTAQARSLIAPQMPLEAMVAMAGGFENIPAADIADMLFIRLQANNKFKCESVLSKKSEEAAELSKDLITNAATQLDALLDKFTNEQNGYSSRTRPQLSSYDGEYDHLARAGEWASAEHSDALDFETGGNS